MVRDSIVLVFGLLGLVSLIIAIISERRMQRHRRPGVSYADVTFRRDGAWRRDDLFQPEGLAYQRRAAKYGFPGMIFLLIAVLALLVACSSGIEPKDDVTVLVTNGSCVNGVCDAQTIHAFPHGRNQVNTPGGPWYLDLGTMTGSSLCFTLPKSASYNVISPNGHGGVDTVTARWDSADPVRLGARLVEPIQFWPSSSTAEFIPASANGWSITLPGDTIAKRAPACTPE